MIRQSIQSDLKELKEAQSIYKEINRLGWDILIPLDKLTHFPTLKHYGKRTHKQENNKRIYYLKFSFQDKDMVLKNAIHELFDEAISLYEKGKLTKKETEEINKYYQWWYSDSLSV